MKGPGLSALYSPSSRGVMILIPKSIPFQVLKVIPDRDGQYLIIHGSLFNKTISLVNVYGPNLDCPAFSENLFLTLTSLPGKLIIAGDFNCTISPVLDRSTGVDSSRTQSRKRLHWLIKELNLCDPRRRLYPNDRAYSCCSSVTKGHSRIDYFLIFNDIFSEVIDCIYDTTVISDHGPVSLLYKFSNMVKGPKRWRLHPKWLHDPKFLMYVGFQIDFYFSINGDETSASIRWEAFKAFLQGQIICYTSSKTHEFNSELKNLEKKNSTPGERSLSKSIKFYQSRTF